MFKPNRNINPWIFVVLTLVFTACGVSSDSGINKHIQVAAGEHRSNGLRSVNGSITVGNSAVVDGNCSTVNGMVSIGETASVGEVACVNGSVSLERGSQAAEISCVNGSIELADKARVNGDVETVNGAIMCKSGVQIAGDLSNVNGHISTRRTFIHGNLSTVNGNIELARDSQVRENIIIDRDHKRSRLKPYKPLTITVTSGSKVKGDIIVKGDDPQVTVILSDGGEVLGEIINADIIRK